MYINPVSNMNSVARIISGEDVKQFSNDKLFEYATKVSEGLAEHPYTMVQFNPRQLVEVIKEGRTILCLDENGNLFSFGQIWHYGESPQGQAIKEFGSWISFQEGGFGVLVLKAARELHSFLYPDSKFVAIVEIENKKAQKVIEELLKVKSEPTYSKFLKTKDGKSALMKLYDITRI